MKASKEFRKKLNKAIRILFREMRDGCCDCRKAKGFCQEHIDEARRIAYDPKSSKELQRLLGTIK